jgi:Protein of unknown function (DUF3574)
VRRWLLKVLLPFVTPIVMLTTGSLEAQQSVRQSPPDRPVLQRRIPNAARKGAIAYVRTELFFGTAKADGTAVTEQEFLAFVDDVIARRFPDGLTVLKGDGQFKGLDGETVKEQSFIVILLYPADGQRESSRRINVIRQLYMNLHDQESVLRVDDPYFVWVSF